MWLVRTILVGVVLVGILRFPIISLDGKVVYVLRLKEWRFWEVYTVPLLVVNYFFLRECDVI